ncbi:fungal-specific transcription factor domain-containing protein [Phycomyces nitens]|nr:fungal-specific transcription factor domain-containing protein [Phycomyces nitens]
MSIEKKQKRPTEYPNDQLQPKRFKVNRACYTCRVKKIKCDGLQPCMQCKARNTSCSFSLDGSIELDSINPKEHDSPGSIPSPTQHTSRNSTIPLAHQKHLAALNESFLKANKALEILGTTWPGEGREGWYVPDRFWLVTQHETEELGSEIPWQAIRHPLITLYFRHLYAILPIIPKREFYNQLENQGQLITPCLLYSMYAHGARFSHDQTVDPEDYYEQACRMVDKSLDRPRISTIIALCLLGLFESTRQGKIGDSGCRAWIYSGMAHRMCLDLRLHKRSFSHGEEELRKRVFWTCYCLDKLQSIYRQQPWVIQAKDIDIDMPMLQPGDDTNEHEIIQGFVAYIQLMKIGERALNPNITETSILQTHEHEQKALLFDNELLHWLRALPPHLQWTPFPSHANAVPTQPPPDEMVAHLHLVYNMLELAVLVPCGSTTTAVQQRCSAVATNITQLTCSMAEQTQSILSNAFAAHTIMAAIRVHLPNCGQSNQSFARHSRVMFQRSIKNLRRLLSEIVIPEIESFTVSLEQTLAMADKTYAQRIDDVKRRTPHLDLYPTFPIALETKDTASSQISRQTDINGLYMKNVDQNATLLLSRSLASSPSTTATTATTSATSATTSATSATTSATSATATDTASLSSLWKQDINPMPKNPLDILSVDPWPTSTTPKSILRETSPNATPFLYRQPPVYTPLHDLQARRIIPNTKTKEWQTPTDSTQEDNLLYSLWSQPEEQTQKSPRIIQPSYMNIGLGVYASAHQHHTDVIRQHVPGMDSNTAVRPVILTHQGQVIVSRTSEGQA